MEKIRLSGVAATLGGALAPVPLRLTVSRAALLVTVRLPVSVPITVGVNVTVIAQLVFGATAAPQLLL